MNNLLGLPEAFFALPANVVHVVHIDPDAARGLLPACQTVLSEAERVRADRLREPDAYRQFVLGRGVLRHLLVGFLDRNPSDIVFIYGSNGGPSVECTGDLDFSLAHTRGWLALAFAVGQRIGIDVEALDQDIACIEIAQRFFRPEELGELEHHDPIEARRRFLRLWTRKEAVLKAAGVGLGGIAECLVLDDDVLMQDDCGLCSNFVLHDLGDHPGYVFSLAVAKERRRVFAWSPCRLG